MSNKQAPRLYEAMFLVDSNRATDDWDALSSRIHEVITRHGGNIERSEKWDERKLAYPIQGHTKATYVLVHFTADPSRIAAIRRTYQLSDAVIRVLIILDEDGITSDVRGLSDEPTDPVRSTRRDRNVEIISKLDQEEDTEEHKDEVDEHKAEDLDDDVETSASEPEVTATGEEDDVE